MKFETLLGYGDVTPLSKPARMFAVTEAIVGQIYPTVLVARLVGLYAPLLCTMMCTKARQCTSYWTKVH